MNFKTFFKDKKNLAITILSVLLIASFSSQGNQSQELSQAEDKIEQLSQDVKQAKSELKDSQDELADFKEENADYIEVGKKEVQKTKEIENSAETAVKNLEKDQTQANLDLATSKVDAVTDADKKEKFQKRIVTVKTAIEAKKEKELEDKAEIAVKNLENNQSRDNIDDAKNKVNAVNNSTKKEAFNNRINAVVSAIEAKEAEAAKQAQEQAAAEAAAQQAQQQQNQAAAQPGDTTTVYITRTGSHYHLNPNCRGLNRSKNTTPVSLSEAQALGLTLCGFE
ncbi:Chromosome partition protein Smc [Streptococcus infantarius subsp. infantarius]|nr:Chromosome partition protein Smc [Streptococcus infantarius subsp. infantarius]MCO4654150.1 Chromosome partition protein Smc [Streptococcus infantarius subsp. infantarius]MCO4678476.1 Chromosome partition protein Smc [Streptococcus infantarius subsp. infantarius]